MERIYLQMEGPRKRKAHVIQYFIDKRIKEENINSEEFETQIKTENVLGDSESPAVVKVEESETKHKLKLKDSDEWKFSETLPVGWKLRSFKSKLIGLEKVVHIRDSSGKIFSCRGTEAHAREPV